MKSRFCRPGARVRALGRWCKVLCKATDSKSNEFVVFIIEDTEETFMASEAIWPAQLRHLASLADATHWRLKPQPGECWQTDDAQFTVVVNAVHVDTGEHFVIYRGKDQRILAATSSF